MSHTHRQYGDLHPVSLFYGGRNEPEPAWRFVSCHVTVENNSPQPVCRVLSYHGISWANEIMSCSQGELCGVVTLPEGTVICILEESIHYKKKVMQRLTLFGVYVKTEIQHLSFLLKVLTQWLWHFSRSKESMALMKSSSSESLDLLQREHG